MSEPHRKKESKPEFLSLEELEKLHAYPFRVVSIYGYEYTFTVCGRAPIGEKQFYGYWNNGIACGYVAKEILWRKV